MPQSPILVSIAARGPPFSMVVMAPPRSPSSIVLDPGEERIKSEFAGVKRTFLPVHSVLRVDEVRKQGVSKITALEAGANVTPFPMGLPPGIDGGSKK